MRYSSTPVSAQNRNAPLVKTGIGQVGGASTGIVRRSARCTARAPPRRRTMPATGRLPSFFDFPGEPHTLGVKRLRFRRHGHSRAVWPGCRGRPGAALLGAGRAGNNVPLVCHARAAGPPGSRKRLRHATEQVQDRRLQILRPSRDGPIPNNLAGVLGPNGCGKSNVFNGLRWVIAEFSANHLRGGSMEDVIVNGSSQRKLVSQASLKLVFDNSDGSLPANSPATMRSRSSTWSTARAALITT